MPAWGPSDGGRPIPRRADPALHADRAPNRHGPAAFFVQFDGHVGHIDGSSRRSIFRHRRLGVRGPFDAGEGETGTFLVSRH